MFSSRWITKSTGTYSDDINRLEEEIKNADAIVICAGAGLSTSAGLSYSGERFEKDFAGFREKYGITDMYSGTPLSTQVCYFQIQILFIEEAAEAGGYQNLNHFYKYFNLYMGSTPALYMKEAKEDAKWIRVRSML